MPAWSKKRGKPIRTSGGGPAKSCSCCGGPTGGCGCYSDGIAPGGFLATFSGVQIFRDCLAFETRLSSAGLDGAVKAGDPRGACGGGKFLDCNGDILALNRWSEEGCDGTILFQQARMLVQVGACCDSTAKKMVVSVLATVGEVPGQSTCNTIIVFRGQKTVDCTKGLGWSVSIDNNITDWGCDGFFALYGKGGSVTVQPIKPPTPGEERCFPATPCATDCSTCAVISNAISISQTGVGVNGYDDTMQVDIPGVCPLRASNGQLEAVLECPAGGIWRLTISNAADSSIHIIYEESPQSDGCPPDTFTHVIENTIPGSGASPVATIDT